MYTIHSEYIWKMEEIPIKYIIFILIMLTSFSQCKIPTIYATEGGVAFLNFTYSCDSTEITLQSGNGAPFYNSRSHTHPSSSNLKLRNETFGKICFLYLTIDPVSRDDQGGYILFAYNNHSVLIGDYRILLLIASPPGEASCALSEKYIDEDWFMLHCTAPFGKIQGLITCYQNGIKIPPLNSPQHLDETLSQTLLAKVGSLVYCCSGTLDRTKDRCDCKDSVWDPTQNKQVTNITDPCPPTIPKQHPSFSQLPIEDNNNVSSSASTKASVIISQQPNSNKALLRLQVVVGVLILAFIASVAGTVCYFKKHSKKSASSKIEEERHLLCEVSTNSAYYVMEKGQNVVTSTVSSVRFVKGAGREKYNGKIDGYNGEWELIDAISVTDNIRFPHIVGCIDECNVIIADRVSGSHHTYMLNIHTKQTQRGLTSSNTYFVTSCALLNDDKVVCGKRRKGCTGDNLTGCISVYDRQWKLINDVTIPRNTTGDATRVYVAADQDGMIIAAERGQSKIYFINPADGNIMNTVTCKQEIVIRGVLSSGHIIAQPSPPDHRVFIIDREGAQREITHNDIIRNVCIDPMTDDLYIVTSSDRYKTCVIDQVMSGGDIIKRRVASFPLSTVLKDRNINLNHFLYSRVMMTSSRNMIACNGDIILVLKKLSL